MPIQQPKNILVAPLDWGSGHTTRCIPIIHYLLQLGQNPVVAGNAAQLSLIEDAFPSGLHTIELPGYNITYSAWNKWMQMGLVSQLPGILRSIKQEHEWLEKKAAELKLDGIISDNRYGLYHHSIPSVILTHQLRIRSGMGDMADSIVQKAHYKHLNRFGATWVVDTENEPCLAGALSHSQQMPESSDYIGLLSRFANTRPATHASGERERLVLLFLLSGPEPQRSNLSRRVWQQAVQHNGPVVFVDGSDKAETPTHIPAHIVYHKRLGTAALLPIITEASIVLCRSGYSTIMDLVALGKKAILIPTPGQTEQQYLGSRLHERGIFYCAKQEGFDLNKALSDCEKFSFNALDLSSAFTQFQPVVDRWLQKL